MTAGFARLVFAHHIPVLDQAFPQNDAVPIGGGRLDPLQERKEKRRKTGEEPSDSDSEDMEELLGRFSNVQQAHCRGRRWMFWLASTNALLRELIQGKSRLWTWEWDVSFAKKCVKWINARLFVR